MVDRIFANDAAITPTNATKFYGDNGTADGPVTVQALLALVPTPPSPPGTATATALGLVKVGANLTVAADGTLSGPAPGGSSYTLPAATAAALGGVKAGSGLSVAGDGTLSATAASITPPRIIADPGPVPALPVDSNNIIVIAKTVPQATTVTLLPGQVVAVIGGRDDTMAITVLPPSGQTINGQTQFPPASGFDYAGSPLSFSGRDEYTFRPFGNGDIGVF